LPDTLDRPAPDAAEMAGDADTHTEESEPETAKLPERDERVQSRIETDAILGRLLSKVRTLEERAVDRWGGIAWQKARAVYEAGDAAYLARDFGQAGKLYEEADQAVTPLLDQVDRVFQATLTNAGAALDAGDTAKALALFELAVAISPDHGPAKAGLARAQNLDEVLALTDQGLQHERELELDAARNAFSRATEIDPKWQVATQGLARVNETIRQMEFDSRMTEGLAALAVQDYVTARAAFRMAKELKPDSPEPADGLLQVDQGLRLGNIGALEIDARAMEEGEQWQQAADAYQQILELDNNLTFANDGLRRSKEMIALHDKVEAFINDPDSLSQDRKMAEATKLVVNITRMPTLGPRLAADRDELSRLLKRAATPLTVRIVSDEMTNVSIYKVAKLGTFDSVEVSLRPGTYVAVGSRPGYRDVRTEFRVAPEIEMDAVVVRCEEQI
jgi:tetratricopeptide (TPR) repeat protein